MAKAAGVVPVTINIKIPQGATFIVSSTARSDAWIKATSASLHNALLTFGDEETLVRPRVQVVFI